LQTPDEELLRMRNFGKKSLDEIKERLAARGLIEAPVRDENAIDDVGAEGGSLDGGPSDDTAPDDGEDETPGSQES
ncbi:MAG TPA: DNA-directed RNA polymerase subunit alpha C-terminal domain-containing protein, partial [Vicinamibacterales bacterium]|nr:DNA-directed RNA polymerase subunit alpha C-terminal domain-containing protein [Vicinamibacterales bacterium]